MWTWNDLNQSQCSKFLFIYATYRWVLSQSYENKNQKTLYKLDIRNYNKHINSGSFQITLNFSIQIDRTYIC